MHHPHLARALAEARQAHIRQAVVGDARTSNLGCCRPSLRAKVKRRVPGLAVLAAVASMLGLTSQADAATTRSATAGDRAGVSDSGESVPERGRSVAGLRLPGVDGQLKFYQWEGEGLEAVLVAEVSTDSGPSRVSALEKLADEDLNPLEVFWGLSAQGTRIPRVIEKLFSKRSDLDRRQGWARRRLARSLAKGRADRASASAADLACDNGWFTSPWWEGGLLSSNPWIRLDRTPATDGGFYEGAGWAPGNGQSWGKPRWEYLARLQTKESRVRVCGRAVQNLYNDHRIFWSQDGVSQPPIYIGPRIRGVFYWNGQWRIMESSSGELASWAIPANQRYYLNWRFYTSQTTAHGVQVVLAKQYDQFDFLVDRPGGA